MRVWLKYIKPLLAEVKAGRMPEVSRRRRGRLPVYRPCRYCGASVTAREWWRGHAGCTHVKRYALPRRGPLPVYRPCRYCGASVTGFEWWNGHADCTRVKRRYTLPGRGPAKTGVILPLTKDEIRSRIDAMSAGAPGSAAEKARLRRGTGAGEWKRAG